MNPLFLIGLMAGVYFLAKNQFSGGTSSGEISAEQMRAQLVNWASASTTDTEYRKRLAIEAFNEMTNAELRAAWYWVFRRQKIEPDLSNLSMKYNLFT